MAVCAPALSCDTSESYQLLQYLPGQSSKSSKHPHHHSSFCGIIVGKDMTQTDHLKVSEYNNTLLNIMIETQTKLVNQLKADYLEEKCRGIYQNV